MDVSAELGNMMAAGEESLKGSWDDIKDVAQLEFKTILYRLKDIAQSVLDPSNSMTKATARYLVKSQVQLAVQAIVAVTTLTIVAVQKAINAALKAVKDTVNNALGVRLL